MDMEEGKQSKYTSENEVRGNSGFLSPDCRKGCFKVHALPPGYPTKPGRAKEGVDEADVHFPLSLWVCETKEWPEEGEGRGKEGERGRGSEGEREGWIEREREKRGEKPGGAEAILGAHRTRAWPTPNPPTAQQPNNPGRFASKGKTRQRPARPARPRP